MTSHSDQLRALPSVDQVLQQAGSQLDRWGRVPVRDAIRQELAHRRSGITGNADCVGPADNSIPAICMAVDRQLAEGDRATLIPVINLSGTVLHTNLGRSPLPQCALDAVAEVSRSTSNLEFDLNTGQRGDRDHHIEPLICELTGAEAATVVNNNAAAVLLALNTLAKGREVAISRGELVEIGGSFRIPEIMAASGCLLRELGSTNRTHPCDYLSAIGPDTALLLRVHTSNYRIEGFTSNVSEAELAGLAAKAGLPLMIDLGSGNLVDFSKLGLPAEPTVADALGNGADLVTFSGDKLLGGPQCGVIAGQRDLISQIKRNPLKRALRVDKMTLAALVEVLRLYRNADQLTTQLPALHMLTREQADIRQQGKRLLPAVQNVLSSHYLVDLVDCQSQVGSGALPIDTLPSCALSIRPLSGDDSQLRLLSTVMRQLPLPIIGRLHDGSYLLDLRCLDNESAFTGQLAQLQQQLA